MNNNNKEILQTGLFSSDEEEIKRTVKRVNAFNLRNIGNAVKLDVIPFEKGDVDVPQPHYKLRFLFPNREAQRAFWAQ